MKTGLVRAALLLPALFLALPACGQNPKAAEPGTLLRNSILTADPLRFGFSSDKDFPEVWGLVSEWHVGDAVLTVVALRDGTASLYTTTGFGIVGGQAHENSRKAAVAFVQFAGEFLSSARESTDRAHPAKGNVCFYFLTYGGLRRTDAKQSALTTEPHELAALYAKVNEVLRELRRSNDKP